MASLTQSKSCVAGREGRPAARCRRVLESLGGLIGLLTSPAWGRRCDSRLTSPQHTASTNSSPTSDGHCWRDRIL